MYYFVDIFPGATLNGHDSNKLNAIVNVMNYWNYGI